MKIYFRSKTYNPPPETSAKLFFNENIMLIRTNIHLGTVNFSGTIPKNMG